jgi:hypothetical protein
MHFQTNKLFFPKNLSTSFNLQLSQGVLKHGRTQIVITPRFKSKAKLQDT